MRICKRDKWKTAFRTRYGHFEYHVISFSLTNAPASFQGYINKIFVEKFDIFVIVYLDDILIYTEDDRDSHFAAVQWVLEQLRNFLLYVNLKKCWFHQDEVWFLGYILTSKGISIEDKQIEAVKQWPKLQLLRDIQVFLGFVNFYRQFFQGFSQIAAPLTSVLKRAESRKGGDGVGGDIRAGRGRNKIDESGINNVEVDGSEVKVDEVRKKGQKMSKSKNLSKAKKKVGSDFLTFGAKLAFIKLRQTFCKALIIYHFYPERLIRIETDVSGYAVGGVFSQLISNDSGQWHPVAFFSCKIILVETRYKTQNGEFLAIVEAFKT